VEEAEASDDTDGVEVEVDVDGDLPCVAEEVVVVVVASCNHREVEVVAGTNPWKKEKEGFCEQFVLWNVIRLRLVSI
jgi:CMP-2-keto-3-deoxyoctulosonic acid synthetase